MFIAQVAVDLVPVFPGPQRGRHPTFCGYPGRRDRSTVGRGVMMTAPVTASERDLRTLAGIISAHRADLPADGLPESLLADLMGQIRCDEVCFVGMDSGQQAQWFGQEVPLTDTPGWDDLERVRNLSTSMRHR